MTKRQRCKQGGTSLARVVQGTGYRVQGTGYSGALHEWTSLMAK